MTLFGLLIVLALLTLLFWFAGRITDLPTQRFARNGLVVIAIIVILWTIFGGSNLHDVRLFR
jgi:hypothetical protein